MVDNLSKLAELIVPIANNEDVALEELFKETKRSFYSIAGKYLVDKNNLDNVISDVYMKIYRNAYRYNPKCNALNWMYEIVKNTALDYNRKYAKEIPISSLEEFDMIYEVVPGLTRREQIRYALNSLTPIEYQIVYLKIWKNRTLKENAEELHENISRVYKIYVGALKKLRKSIK